MPIKFCSEAYFFQACTHEDNWVATLLRKSTLLDLKERNANHITRRTAICQSVAEV